jgi:hypothetical protein
MVGAYSKAYASATLPAAAGDRSSRSLGFSAHAYGMRGMRSRARGVRRTTTPVYGIISSVLGHVWGSACAGVFGPGMHAGSSVDRGQLCHPASRSSFSSSRSIDRSASGQLVHVPGAWGFDTGCHSHLGRIGLTKGCFPLVGAAIESCRIDHCSCVRGEVRIRARTCRPRVGGLRMAAVERTPWHRAELVAVQHPAGLGARGIEMIAPNAAMRAMCKLACPIGGDTW